MDVAWSSYSRIGINSPDNNMRHISNGLITRACRRVSSRLRRLLTADAKPYALKEEQYE